MFFMVIIRNYLKKNGDYYSNALYFPIELDVSSMSPQCSPQCLLNESSSLLIALVYPSLTNASAKILLFNHFLRGPENGNFGRYEVTVNTYKANRLYYTSICVRW